MIVALLACTCPSFGEMEVVAGDSSATPDRIETVQQALADFAAWTGDDGVCVPQIRLQKDLPERIAVDDSWEVVGRYDGKHDPIRIDADFGELRNSTFHELCHAADQLEGHSGAMEWPEVADRSVYPGAHAPREDFAQACAEGPADITLEAAFVTACGTTPAFSEEDSYLEEVMFPEAPRPGWSDTQYAYTEASTPWEGVPYAVAMYDARVVGDEVLFLLYDYDDNDVFYVYIAAFDLTLTEAHWEAVIAEDVGLYKGWFIEADVGAYVGLQIWGEEQQIVEVDQHGVVRALGTGGPPPGTPMAIAGEVLYAAQDDTLLAWTLDGDPVSLDPPVDKLPPPFDVDFLWPEGDGVAFYAGDVLGRYDATADAWTVEPAIGEVTSRVDLGDGRSLVKVTGTAPRFVYERGTHAFLGDPCLETAPDIGNTYVQSGADGRLVWFDWASFGGDPVYVLKEVTVESG